MTLQYPHISEVDGTLPWEYCKRCGISLRWVEARESECLYVVSVMRYGADRVSLDVRVPTR